MPSMPLPPLPPPPAQGPPSPAAAGHSDALAQGLAEPPVAGNRVTLIEGAGAGVLALDAAMAAAADHINLDAALLDTEGGAERLLRRLAACSRAGVGVNLLVDPMGPLRAGSAWHRALRDAGVNLALREPVPRRLMVADGACAFVGDAGAAFTAQPLLLRVQGPVVQPLQRMFVAHWQRRAEAAMTPARLFPPPVPAGTQRVALATHDAGGAAEGNPLGLAAALLAARRRVLLCTGGLPPSRRLAQALAQAARRGVQVDLLGPGTADGSGALRSARALYAALLAAGVHVCERHPAAPPPEACVIDGLWTSIAAGAGARAARRGAGRADLVVLDGEFAARFEALLRLRCAIAEPVDPARWQRRPWWVRLRQALAAP